MWKEVSPILDRERASGAWAGSEVVTSPLHYDC